MKNDLLIIDDPDGRAFRNISKAESLPDTVFQKISIQANELFNKQDHPPLREGMLICTVDLGNQTLQYRIFKVNSDGTVTIALPDLEMKTVPVTSLYYPDVAVKLYLESNDQV